MKGKIGSGGAPLQTITPRGNAEIIVALEDINSGLYARTLNNTPANEAAIRGF